MRADKAIRLEGQAGQVDLALARRDARGENPLLPNLPTLFSPRSNWKISMGLLIRVSARRTLGRCAVVISVRGAPCRDESRDDARANRAPESFMQGLVFTRKGLPLAR
jgi:hypothetical protein